MAQMVSLKRKKLPLDLELEDGRIVHCELRDLVGTERDAYLTFMAQKMEMNPDGASGRVKDATGLQSKLISMCLYDGEDKEAQKVPQAQVDAWPGEAQTTVYDMAQKLCGLDKKATQNAKNS